MRTLAFVLLLATVSTAGLDKAALKRMEAFAVKWWKARPKTKFHDWDPAVREALLEEARGFGAIPEGSLGRVTAALWKPLKKHGPKWRGNKFEVKDHGYESQYTSDRMWAQLKKPGKGKGLVISLHGGGEGAGSADGSWPIKGCGILAPQGLLIHGDNWNRVHGEKQILTMFEMVKAQCDIDTDRVYVVGFSMGGTGSWHMAGRFPDYFAGAAPCNGVVMARPVSQVRTVEEVISIQYGLIPNVRNLPLYFCTGLKDKNCMPGTFLYVWDLIQELKQEDPGGYEQIRFECHENLAHAFGPGQPGKTLAWLGEQRRDTYPEKIVWEYATSPHPRPDEKDTTRRYQKRYFYWVRHDRPQDRMEVVAEREGNEFTILSSADREGFYLLLNPEMIDVEKEVVVRLEGEEVYRGKPVPDFVTVLETLDARLDKRLAFDRKIRLWGSE